MTNKRNRLKQRNLAQIETLVAVQTIFSSARLTNLMLCGAKTDILDANTSNDSLSSSVLPARLAVSDDVLIYSSTFAIY